MIEAIFALALLAAVPSSDSTAASPTVTPDSSVTVPAVVREFPPVEVRVLLHDMRSSQTVHLIPGAALHDYPVDRLADVIALQPGVVAQGEELHVRGGRTGETMVNLDELNLNDPFRYTPIDVPLLALRSAELVSGAPEAQHATGLAGGLNLRSIDPGERFDGVFQWQTDANLDTHYDRLAARVGGPVGAFGLGVVAAGEAMLDDTWIPNLRTKRRHRVAGMSFGWRAENRMSGYMKLAPVERPDRFSVQVLVNRQVHEPYHPNFTLDGWVYVDPNLKFTPKFSTEPQDSFIRYRAADHMAITDDRQIATLVRVGNVGRRSQTTLSLGWLRTSSTTSIGGQREPASASHRSRWGNPIDSDLFYSLWGDYSLYRETDADVFTLRAETVHAARTGSLRLGGQLTHESVKYREMDWRPLAIRAANEYLPEPEDSIRVYDTGAPGASAWVQGRWNQGGMILNVGLRADWFDPGRDVDAQTLPGTGKGILSFGPRFGISYPISVQDVFSLAYCRVQQAPARDYLYDQRTVITNRQPLGNPALRPATLVSYEVAVKHLFGPEWATQASLFYRDVFEQVGALDTKVGDITNLSYQNADESHTIGVEWTATFSGRGRRQLSAHYVWLTAWGNESRPEGDPYGTFRAPHTPGTGERPVSWDRRHSVLVAGTWPLHRRVFLSWSTSLSSGLPWTPKDLRQPLVDRDLINSRRLSWTRNTDMNLQWMVSERNGLTLGVEARNVFDERRERYVSIDGYPNQFINTVWDDYGAYRTQTGNPGGAYWSHTSGRWIPVNDPRLFDPPRTVRAFMSVRW